MKRFRKGYLQEAREKPFAINNKTNKWTHLSVDSGTVKYVIFYWADAQYETGFFK